MKRHHFHILILIFALTFQPAGVNAQETLYRIYQLAKGAYKVHEALNVTDEELAEYMAETMKYQDAQNKVCTSSSKYTIRINKITKGLKSVNDTPLNFKVYYDTQTANAFASPDGSIRIYSKLMDIMTDEELLGIIGHELGHIACNHSLKEYKAALLASAVRDGLMADDGTLGELASSCIGSIAEQMITAKYSRTQELEADDYGYDYLVENNRNPMAIAKALSKLQKLENDKSGKYVRYINTLFSSHPDIKERVKKLTQRAEEDGYK